MRDRHFGRHGFGRGRPHWMHHGRPGRARRGDIKYEILAVLADGPRHGYEIMLAIEERRGGIRPSPGSIYPSLQLLEDEEFVTSSEAGGKRVYTLTDKGREHLAKRAEERAGEEDFVDEDHLHETMSKGWKAVKGIALGVKEIARSGNPQAIGKVVDVLDRARREIYQILADEL